MPGVALVDPTPYQGLVKAIAGKVKKKSPRYIEFEDLVGYGMVGLMEACNRYDEAKGKFVTFAYHRIRGAMLDYVMKQREEAENCSPVGEVNDAAIDEPEDLTEEMALLQKALATLPQRERELLLAERGNKERTHLAYGISRSWSSRLKADATRLLKARMKGNGAA